MGINNAWKSTHDKVKTFSHRQFRK